MGIKQTVRDAVTTAIAAIGDLADTITYESVALGSYNPTTDAMTSTNTTKTVSGLVYNEADAELDGLIDRTSTSGRAAGQMRNVKFVLIAGDALDPVVPKEADYMTILTVRYEVVAISAIPGQAGYIFTVRKP